MLMLSNGNKIYLYTSTANKIYLYIIFLNDTTVLNSVVQWISDLKKIKFLLNLDKINLFNTGSEKMA